ncbi:hypothetical protein FQA47_007072 [Oryzias melastigma]|uniref:Uncharacterized protein n=1 Tax=Oryzias melastigma TaxID=30732 RepID=A0A834BQU5_ORYME|nr:hypothetical protein FQA47_007072 [Oryzias melastigma]
MDRSRTESINVSEMMGQRDPGPPSPAPIGAPSATDPAFLRDVTVRIKHKEEAGSERSLLDTRERRELGEASL